MAEYLPRFQRIIVKCFEKGTCFTSRTLFHSPSGCALHYVTLATFMEKPVHVFDKKKKTKGPGPLGIPDSIVTFFDNVWAASDPLEKRQSIHFANLLPELTFLSTGALHFVSSKWCNSKAPLNVFVI